MKPDTKMFPCLKLAYDAGEAGGTNPAVLNAANEVAVEEFINGKIKFTNIPKIIEKVLSLNDAVNEPSLEEIIQADRWARQQAQKIIERKRS